MIDIYKEMISNQYEATLCMLATCIDRCPETSWDAPVVNYKFCQVAFHVLFFTDLYLGRDLSALREQPFHRDNASFFGNYEELGDQVPQTVHEKPAIMKYLEHCRGKAAEVVAGETAETLGIRPGFDWLEFSRAEVHVYSIRHIHHHAAQLSLRLRIDAGEDIPWFGSGWRDV